MVDTLDALLAMESEDVAVAHAAYRWRCLLHQEETSCQSPGGMSHRRHPRDTTTVSCMCGYGILRAGRGLRLGPDDDGRDRCIDRCIAIYSERRCPLLPDGPTLPARTTNGPTSCCA